MGDWKPPTGGSSKTVNCQTSHPSVNCGNACIVGGQGAFVTPKNLLGYESIYCPSKSKFFV